MESVVLVWQRLGPYHMARLQALAARLARGGVSVHGLEVAGADLYGWRHVDTPGEIRRTCLFPDRNYGDLLAGEVHTAVHSALNDIDPICVGINGWSVKEARAALGWCRRNGRDAVLFSETKENESRRVWWKELLKKRLVKRFDAAVVGGRLHADYAIRLGIPPGRVFQGYDAVDNDYFCTAADAVRDADTSPYFLANARLLTRKNIDGLIRAYAAYRATAGEPWNLVITGSGTEEDALKRLAQKLGVVDTVKFAGFVQYDELPRYYANAGAFVHPAKSEPWGLVVNEACASGLPVLVSGTVGAGHELVRDGENGIIFDPYDEAAIASALRTIAEMDPGARKKMGARSREIVSEWGPERFADAFYKAMEVGK